jgi:PST family polysaccharide transporter
MATSLRALSLKGFLWSAGESVGVALASFASFLVMARALEPKDFGIVALAGVFVFFLNLITGHGVADAIVQRLRLEPDHLDTAFWSALGLALVLMGLCQGAAGMVGALFGEPALAEVLVWLSLSLPLGALGSVPLALSRRDMRFQIAAACGVAGRLAGAAVGIVMALTGFGLWSLVGQQLVGVLVSSMAIVWAADWRPRLRFSTRHLRDIWAFGFHVSAAQVVTGAGEQVLNLLIGTLFGTTALGYFNVAWRMVQLIRSVIGSAVYHVGLSAFAKLQEDRAAVARAFLDATRLSCLVGFPIGAGLALLGEPLLVALFGAKWQASAPLLMVLAIEMIPAFYGMFLSALYRAMGRAAWVLGMALLYFGVGLAGVLALAPFGVLAIAAFWVARAWLLMPLHVALVARLLATPALGVARPGLAPLVATLAMAAGLLVLRFELAGLELGPLATLAVFVPAGALLYVLAIRVTAPELTGMAIRTVRLMVAPAPKAPPAAPDATAPRDAGGPVQGWRGR